MRRRLDADPFRALLTAAGLQVEVLQGDGVLESWVPGAASEDGPAAAGLVAELELLGAAEPALLAVAPRLHALGRQPARP